MPQPTPTDTVVVTVPKSKPTSNLGLHYGRYDVVDASDQMAKRGSDIPMPVVAVLMRALSDPRITSVIALKTLGVLSQHADEDGIVHPADDGQWVTDPNY